MGQSVFCFCSRKCKFWCQEGPIDGVKTIPFNFWLDIDRKLRGEYDRRKKGATPNERRKKNFSFFFFLSQSPTTPFPLLRTRQGEQQSQGGTFNLMKNSGLNFRKFLVTNGTAFSGISRTEENLARNAEIFGNFLPRITDFPPTISEISGWMVRFSKILQFPDCWRFPFRIFSEFNLTILVH